MKQFCLCCLLWWLGLTLRLKMKLLGFNPQKGWQISAAPFVRFLFQHTLTEGHWQRSSQKKGASSCSRFVHEHFRCPKKPLTAVSALFVKAPYTACRTVWRFRPEKKGLKKILEIIKAFTLPASEISHIHVLGKHLPRLFLKDLPDCFWWIVYNFPRQYISILHYSYL